MRTFKLMYHIGLSMVSSDKPLIFGEKPIPISQKCRTCRQEILVSEFDFSDRARDKRAALVRVVWRRKTTSLLVPVAKIILKKW